MGRRTVAGLLTTLALLVAPASAGAVASPPPVEGHSAARVTVVDHHAPLVHAAASSTKQERRSAHHTSWSPAFVGGTVGVAPAATRARLETSGASFVTDLRSSARPRAPPAVV
jgi:hypothetical protein